MALDIAARAGCLWREHDHATGSTTYSLPKVNEVGTY